MNALVLPRLLYQPVPCKSVGAIYASFTRLFMNKSDRVERSNPCSFRGRVEALRRKYACPPWATISARVWRYMRLDSTRTVIGYRHTFGLPRPGLRFVRRLDRSVATPSFVLWSVETSFSVLPVSSVAATDHRVRPYSLF